MLEAFVKCLPKASTTSNASDINVKLVFKTGKGNGPNLTYIIFILSHTNERGESYFNSEIYPIQDSPLASIKRFLLYITV